MLMIQNARSFSESSDCRLSDFGAKRCRVLAGKHGDYKSDFDAFLKSEQTPLAHDTQMSEVARLPLIDVHP